MAIGTIGFGLAVGLGAAIFTLLTGGSLLWVLAAYSGIGTTAVLAVAILRCIELAPVDAPTPRKTRGPIGMAN